MPFIGQEPITGAFHKLDAITTSATATYNLQLNGGAYSPASANHLMVSLNGVIQAPQDSFTVSGSQIIFDSALTSSDSIDFIMAYGDVLNIGTPSDGSVNTNQLSNDAVTTVKINDDAVTTAKIVGGAIDGSHLDTDAFMIDTWYHSGDIVSSGSSFIIGYSDSSNFTNQTNTNRGSSRMSESSGTFTFPSTGIYRIDFFGTFYADGADTNVRADIATTTDNSTYTDVVRQSIFHTASTQFASCHASYVFDVTNTTTHKVRFTMDSATGATIKGGGSPMYTYVIFERLGDT